MGDLDMVKSASDETAPPFEVFKARDATDYDETVMYPGDATEEDKRGAAALVEAGLNEGSRVKLLYRRPGMSLTYCWFKSGFPLPLHSHNADCVYFIVSGTVRMGTEELGPGDGFFVGVDVPYSYVPGKDGAEVLEYRTSSQFNGTPLGKTRAYWDRALADLLAAKVHWPEEAAPPSNMEVG
jgi:mannose-6-phosphate isomerase-like protein (cupin superfamily)